MKIPYNGVQQLQNQEDMKKQIHKFLESTRENKQIWNLLNADIEPGIVKQVVM
jgi:hypothetical protein